MTQTLTHCWIRRVGSFWAKLRELDTDLYPAPGGRTKKRKTLTHCRNASQVVGTRAYDRGVTFSRKKNVLNDGAGTP